MTYETPPAYQIPEPYYAALFAALPTSSLLLKAEVPQYTIVAATPQHLKHGGVKKEDIIGKGLFEAYPGNPDNSAETGEPNLRASLDFVVQSGQSHQLPVQRYDVADKNGLFVERYWQAENKPVLGPGGEVAYILQTVEELTEQLKAEARESRMKGMEVVNNLFMQTPIPICLLKGPGLVVELANEPTLHLWGKGKEVIGLPLEQALPEVKGQGYVEMINKVKETGLARQVYESPVSLVRNGKEEIVYMNYVYEPYYEDGQAEAVGVLAIGSDVTDKVLAKKAVIQSEARFRSMIEQAPVAITLSRGMDVVIESINAPMVKFMNKTSVEEVLGKKMLEALPELEGQPAYQTILNVQKTGIPFRGNEQPVDLLVDGELKRHYFDFSYTPIMEEGTTAAVLHVAIDVTQQVVSKKKIEESEGRFRLLADASPNLIWMLKPDGSYGYVNKTALHFLGVTQEEMAEWGWAPFQHPDELETITQTLTEAIKNGLAYEREHRMRHKNGQYRWLLSQALPSFDAEGNVFAYVGSSIDIHEAKIAQQALAESESRFRKLADESPIFVFIIDAEPLAPVSYWNKTWLHYTGQTAEEAFGRAWNGILHPDDVALVMKHYTPAFEAREPYFIPAVRVKRYDGVYRWHSFKGNPRYGANGDFSGYVGVGFDIHEQKVVEQELEGIVARRTEELQRINKELQRSNQNLEEFAHAASHDLKEPVRKILFFTNQLRDQLRDHANESEIRSFNRIENATQRMGSLIDDLLLYSHVSHRPHQTEPVDLNEKVERVLEDLELDVEEKKATIKVGQLPVVMGYGRQLQQLFQNLISNALKYSKVDVLPIIEITADEVEKSGIRYYLISVKDNGIGFTQEYENKIFQMFARLHGKGEYIGTGVGLSIVKKVVENHTGLIEVESVVKEGSNFKIYLPV